MNIDISNAHCGPRIQFLDHAWLRVVIRYKRLLASVYPRRVILAVSRFRRCNAFRCRVDDTREIRATYERKLGCSSAFATARARVVEACNLSRARKERGERDENMIIVRTRVRAFTASCVVVLKRPPVCCTAPRIRHTHGSLSARTGGVDLPSRSARDLFTVLPTSPEMKNLS